MNILKEMQKQMLWEAEHDNDCRDNPRFWVLRERQTIPTSMDYADRMSYYYKDGDSVEFTSVDQLQAFLIPYKMTYDINENDWHYYINTNGPSFQELWKWVKNNLNISGFFGDSPVKDEYHIIPDTLFFTKAKAISHIEDYGYHYSDTVHPYAMTAVRSTEVEALIKFAQTFDFEQQGNGDWVSVQDRMPEESGHYLVTSDLNMYHGGNHETNDDGKARSMSVGFFSADEFNVPKVIAWKQLPKPYNGKTQAMERDRLIDTLLELNGTDVILRLTDGGVCKGVLNYSYGSVSLGQPAQMSKNVPMMNIQDIIRNESE